ncbi:MAG: ribose-5-phosphate isomerase [Clostridiales bacterium]|jgi:ribose 5-phosphate isomerase RpiB|nr:ribose-5-phosphate isomerase [Clostridiales bacterium]
MKIAVINEVSARDKNPMIVEALENRGFDLFNVGMKSGDDNPSELTYIHTSLMAAILLNLGAVDFVVGGCGTGQGFLIASMQYPCVYTGLIVDPLDAWLYSQINGGNCISLPLNKGFGWAANLNLKIIFDKLFQDEFGAGYPEARKASQKQSRERLQAISNYTHRSMEEILQETDEEILKAIFSYPDFKELVQGEVKDKRLQNFIIGNYL